MGDPQAFIDQITELQNKASKLSVSDDGNVSVIQQSASLLLEFIKNNAERTPTSLKDDSLQNVTLNLLNAMKETVICLSKRTSTVKKEVKLEPQGAEDLFEVSDIEGDEAMDEVNNPTDVKVEPKEEEEDLFEVSDFGEDETKFHGDAAVGGKVVSKEERRESANIKERKSMPTQSAPPASPAVNRAPPRTGIATGWNDGTPFSPGFNSARFRIAMHLDNENRKSGCKYSMHSFFDRTDRACLMYELLLKATGMKKMSFERIIEESRQRQWVQMDLVSWTESWEGPFRLAQASSEVRSAIVDRLREDKYARLSVISVKTIELLEKHHNAGNFETIRRVIDLTIEKSHELEEAWGEDMIEQEVQKIGVPLSQDPRTIRKRKAKAAAKERKRMVEESMKNGEKDEKKDENRKDKTKVNVEKKKVDDPVKTGEDMEVDI